MPGGEGEEAERGSDQGVVGFRVDEEFVNGPWSMYAITRIRPPQRPQRSTSSSNMRLSNDAQSSRRARGKEGKRRFRHMACGREDISCIGAKIR